MNNKTIAIDIKEKEKTTWIWIKHQLALFDSSLSKLARLHSVAPSIMAVVRHKPYPKSERIIAEALGLKPEDLWPWRYDAAGNPNRISSRYRGHKAFLDNTRNENKINGKEQRRNCHETQN